MRPLGLLRHHHALELPGATVPVVCHATAVAGPCYDSSMRKQHTRAIRCTVTVPAELFDWAEQEREEQGMNRSEFVTSLYRQRRDEQILREREARYRAAYAKQPTTQEEHEWAAAGGEALAALYKDEAD